MEGALTVDDVTLRRGGRRVLDAVRFEARRGEVVALIGPNGAGKTTLIECVVGALRADAGAVRFDGRSLRTLGERARTFAYMSDDAELPGELTVREVVELAVRLARTPVERARSLRDDLGVDVLLGARIADLSRGERRRIALFQALCLDRPVAVLDEPFGVFDPRQLAAVLDVVRRHAREGRVVIASVHQMSDAEKIADRVVLLCAGRVLASGSLDELAKGLPEVQTGAPRSSPSLEAVFLGWLARAEGPDAQA